MLSTIAFARFNLISVLLRNFKRNLNMNVFTQKLNPITGKCDWEVQNEDYDFHQEVASAAFADMLHDTERNQKYEQALKVAIDYLHGLGKKANVLDIGTGTGLLSMMAVRNGADSVTACEAFKPMSECALKVIKRNGFEDKILLIPKRSTDIILGEDMKFRANILITEVFDTELIGEGALSTFSHAHKELLEKDSIVIPHKATVYAQIIESPLIRNWNRLSDIFNDDGELLLKVPKSMNDCLGAAAVHDIQLSQIDLNYIKFLSDPQKIFNFDWSGKTELIFDRNSIIKLKAKTGGKAQAVFMWWDLNMDINNEIILSCAPIWAHPDALKSRNFNPASIPWRDHWMQAVYYLPQEFPITKSQEELQLISYHDEYSLWFDVKPSNTQPNLEYKGPVCNCNMHLAFSRTRIGELNDKVRMKKYLKLIEKHVNSSSIILIASHGFYLALTALKYGAKSIIFYEENLLTRNVIKEFIDANNLGKNVHVISEIKQVKDVLKDGEKINMVLSEPVYTSSILPWYNLRLCYLLQEFHSHQVIDNDNIKVFPKNAVIKSVAVNFKDLYKIRSPLVDCEGFKMDDFDNLIMTSSSISDECVEPQPLWEYPGISQSTVLDVAKVNLEAYNGLKTIEAQGIYQLTEPGKCNGLAFWVDWDLDGNERQIVSTGPIAPIVPGEKIQWYMHVRQGVHLFKINPDTSVVKYNFNFNPTSGKISVHITT